MHEIISCILTIFVLLIQFSGRKQLDRFRQVYFKKPCNVAPISWFRAVVTCQLVRVSGISALYYFSEFRVFILPAAVVSFVESICILIYIPVSRLSPLCWLMHKYDETYYIVYFLMNLFLIFKLFYWNIFISGLNLDSCPSLWHLDCQATSWIKPNQRQWTSLSLPLSRNLDMPSMTVLSQMLHHLRLF